MLRHALNEMVLAYQQIDKEILPNVTNRRNDHQKWSCRSLGLFQ